LVAYHSKHLLYIPREYYNPDPSCQSQNDSSELDSVYKLPLLPLLINIHGTGRDAEKCRDRLKDFAHSERVAILAPLFPAGIDSYTDLDNCKVLKYKTMRSDLLLLQMLDEVALRWPGIETQKVFMMGFSGGGQFVQRFMYLHSERLLAVSIGAPGRVTAIGKSMKWPDGIQDLEEVFGHVTSVDKEIIRKLPIQLVVGGADNMVHGGDEFWKWLEEKKDELKKEKGLSERDSDSKTAAPRMGRLDVLKALQKVWQEVGISSTLDVVDGIKHDSGGVLDVVQAFFRPHLKLYLR
jgi:hypothetical protein